MTYTEKTTTTKRITKEEKKLLQKKTNQENLALAIGTLENIETNYSYKVTRNSKRRIHELLDLLQHADQNISLSIRDANAISILDSISQDRRIESHVRTMLWQVVSNLEGMRIIFHDESQIAVRFYLHGMNCLPLVEMIRYYAQI